MRIPRDLDIVDFGQVAPAWVLSGASPPEAMAEKLGADCACGFTFSTPHGQDDAMAILQLHLSRVHPTMKATREEVAKTIVKR